MTAPLTQLLAPAAAPASAATRSGVRRFRRLTACVLAILLGIAVMRACSGDAAVDTVWISRMDPRADVRDGPPSAGGELTEWTLTPDSRVRDGWPVRRLVRRGSTPPSWPLIREVHSLFPTPDGAVVVAIQRGAAAADGWEPFDVYTELPSEGWSVDPALVGTWEVSLALKQGPVEFDLVLAPDGTYTFLSGYAGVWTSRQGVVLFAKDEDGTTTVVAGAVVSGDPPTMRTGYGWCGQRRGDGGGR